MKNISHHDYLSAHRCETKKIFDWTRHRWVMVEAYDIGRAEPTLSTLQWPGRVGQPQKEGWHGRGTHANR